jgi:hypothetical protein
MTTYLMDGYNQGDDPNKNWKKLTLFIAAVILATILFGLLSCNPEKKIAKAKQTVLTDSAAFDFIGRKFVDLNPCANVVKYKSDTLEIHDTTQSFFNYTDTVTKKDTVIKTITVKVKQIIRDTTTVIDNQKVTLLTESNTRKDLQIAQMNGQLIASHEAYDIIKKKLTIAYFIIGGIVLILFGTIVFKIYSMVTSKTISTAGTTTTGIVSSITNLIKGK